MQTKPVRHPLPHKPIIRAELAMNSNVISNMSGNMNLGNKMHKVQNTKKVVRLIRYALCGAIVGVAVTGLIGRYFGLDGDNIKDIFGAAVGFTAVIAVNIFHL